jgi:hypothetical protein
MSGIKIRLGGLFVGMTIRGLSNHRISHGCVGPLIANSYFLPVVLV